MKEIWKDIDGLEGFYQISSLGRVKSLNYKKTGEERILKQSISDGRHFICLRGKTYLIHRLVAIAFIPNPENKDTVNHINCDPSDNRADNLEWMSKHDNIMHYFRSEKCREIFATNPYMQKKKR